MSYIKIENQITEVFLDIILYCTKEMSVIIYKISYIKKRYVVNSNILLLSQF
jgi:hypothetical protein